MRHIQAASFPLLHSHTHSWPSLPAAQLYVSSLGLGACVLLAKGGGALQLTQSRSMSMFSLVMSLASITVPSIEAFAIVAFRAALSAAPLFGADLVALFGDALLGERLPGNEDGSRSCASWSIESSEGSAQRVG